MEDEPKRLQRMVDVLTLAVAAWAALCFAVPAWLLWGRVVR